jgi:hypothetical protein
MPLSAEELQQLENDFRSELEREHSSREERAQQKAVRRQDRKKQSRSHNSDVEQLKAQMRMEFYQKHGYEESLDPTGRKMYLSPTERQNRSRRASKVKSRKSQANSAKVFHKQFGMWPVYIGATFVAVVIALMLVRS